MSSHFSFCHKGNLLKSEFQQNIWRKARVQPFFDRVSEFATQPDHMTCGRRDRFRQHSAVKTFSGRGQILCHEVHTTWRVVNDSVLVNKRPLLVGQRWRLHQFTATGRRWPQQNQSINQYIYFFNTKHIKYKMLEKGINWRNYLMDSYCTHCFIV